MAAASKTARASSSRSSTASAPQCRPDFQLGLRLSPERFGVKLPEIREVAAEVLRQGKIDYLDMSLWDYTIEPPTRRSRAAR